MRIQVLGPFRRRVNYKYKKIWMSTYTLIGEKDFSEGYLSAFLKKSIKPFEKYGFTTSPLRISSKGAEMFRVEMRLDPTLDPNIKFLRAFNLGIEGVVMSKIIKGIKKFDL